MTFTWWHSTFYRCRYVNIIQACLMQQQGAHKPQAWIKGLPASWYYKTKLWPHRLDCLTCVIKDKLSNSLNPRKFLVYEKSLKDQNLRESYDHSWTKLQDLELTAIKRNRDCPWNCSLRRYKHSQSQQAFGLGTDAVWGEAEMCPRHLSLHWQLQPWQKPMGQMDSPRSVPKANPSDKEHVLVWIWSIN